MAERIPLADIMSTASRLTPAQEVMRSDMEKPKDPGPSVTGQPAVNVEALAIMVIDQEEGKLNLSLREWSVVQRMVEQGIQVGMERK